MSLRFCLLALAWAPLVLADVKSEGLSFLKENGKKPGVVTTATGLQYEVLKSGPSTGPHPQPNSKCICHYRGTLINGQEFDSSYKRGSPATFKPNQVVAGWTEALQLMRPGDKWQLVLPSNLGYGDRGSGSLIPGGAVLIFELELLEIKEAGSFIDEIIDTVKSNPMLLFVGLYVLYMAYSAFRGRAPSGKVLNLKEAAASPSNVKVYFDVKIGDAEPGRVEMLLFTEHYPNTAENFRALCTGEKGTGKSGKALSYKGSSFHRIIPGFMCQGGDFTRGNGSGGESIYGSKFQDEWTHGYVSHSQAGLLSMANAGKDTNGSQFFFTLAPCSHLDNKHVVFGQVLSGMSVVKEMEAVGSSSGSTSKKVTVVDCGEVKGKST